MSQLILAVSCTQVPPRRHPSGSQLILAGVRRWQVGHINHLHCLAGLYYSSASLLFLKLQHVNYRTAMPRVALIAALSSLVVAGAAKSHDASPAFPVPAWTHGAEDLETAFDTIADRLSALVSDRKYDTSSFSIEITSNTKTVWTQYHTARKQNETRPGVRHVSGDSVYRIASITKTFTVLALLYQQSAGNLSLDDPVSRYVAELAEPDSGEIPWKDITLRSLASQLSGIPREAMQSDLINELPDPTKVGLPPASNKCLLNCYEYNNWSPCNRTEVLHNLKKRKPIFAPNQQSTYSNVNYLLLGLVLENVTGMAYHDYVRQTIFEPLDMSSSSLEKPLDEHAVLPLRQYRWDVDEGIHNPAGGIYSSSSDISKYVRYILTHYNALAKGVNWMMPASWSTGVNSFYGMPFEIFRTDRILRDSKRPVTFVGKAGGVEQYYSWMSILPEYGLGITMMVGGDYSLLRAIQEIVSVDLVRAAEDLIWKDVDNNYSGTYLSTDPSLNSSISLSVSPTTGLVMNSFVSNGTDVFASLLSDSSQHEAQPRPLQLVPTLLFKNETAQQGEIWRWLMAPECTKGEQRPVFEDLSITDVDQEMYAGLPLNEVVFWHEETVIELPAWKVKLRHQNEDGRSTLVVQE